jgi:hypothetical protein
MCQSNVNAKPQGGLDTTQRAHTVACARSARGQSAEIHTRLASFALIITEVRA